MSKRLLFIIFGSLTIINVLVFLNRKYFEYRAVTPVEKLYAPCDQSCSVKWEQYLHDYPEQERAIAQRLLDTVLKGNNLQTTEKIKLIGNYLRDLFAGQHGVPTRELMSQTPMQQFNTLRNDRDQHIWCGNWSNIFNYLCWNAGITSRIIEIEKPGDHHVLNECYLPEDSAWGLVDLTNDIILPRKKDSSYYQLISLTGDSVSKPTSHYRSSYPLLYYYRYRLENIYSLGSRARRYLLPDPWYEKPDLQQENRGNLLFYLKLGFLIMWVIAGGILVVLHFKSSTWQRH